MPEYLKKMFRYLKGIRSLYQRKVKWRHYKIAAGFHAGIRVRLWAKESLQIGKNFYIGRDSFIETDCIIGDNVIVANKVGIVGRYDHNFQQTGVPIRLASSIRDNDYAWKGKGLITRIGHDVWIGYGAVIVGGVTIKEGAIIAAGSVVVKDVEAFCIYGGNPAKKIGERFSSKAELDLHKKIISERYPNIVAIEKRDKVIIIALKNAKEGVL